MNLKLRGKLQKRCEEILSFRRKHPGAPDPLVRPSSDKAQCANHNLSDKIKAEQERLLITKYVIIN